VSVSNAELTALAATYDIIALGMQADEVRRSRHGRRTTFVRVADVGAAPGEPVAIPPAAGEVRIAGVPASRQSALERVREVSTGAAPKAISGFSLADLEALAVREGVTLRSLLEELRAAGLELIAEAPFDLLANARRSIEEVNIAGLVLARLTVDRHAAADSSALLSEVAALQREVGVVRAFAPLARRPNPAVPTTGYEDVKRVALARLSVDVPSIQVDWSLYGPKLAQVALTVGADDVDAVSPYDDLSEGRRRAPREEVLRNIQAAGLLPAERNGRFEIAAS
jgi:aminodeoxyfutalosine synthase